MKKTPEKIFDLRTLEANLAKGLITQKEYDAYLQNLSDDVENVEYLELGDDEFDDEDDYEDEEELEEEDEPQA